MTLPTEARTKARTFGEILADRAESAEHELAFSFSHDGLTEPVTFTNGELHARAQAVAARLLDIASPGGHALLLFAPGLDYVAAVFGCFQAGFVGVSATPPHPKRLHRTLPRLFAIAEDAQVDVVLTTEAIAEAASPLLGGDHLLGQAPWATIDGEPPRDQPGVMPRAGSDLAFMQYTSGSTSDPRGVMLTHENLLANSEFIKRGYGHTRESRGFIWLPPYHDMGLIGGVLQPMYIGFPCSLMSPTTVIKRPQRWLQGVSSFRATTSGGPNFAYDLVANRVDPETVEDLDLSTWEVAFNGAEPVLASTIERFTAKFGPYGFKRSAFYPCYGLAEATLMVTGPEKEAEPTLLEVGGRTLVGCGVAATDHEVAIIDVDTLQRVEPGTVGEIWVRGPSVAAGYWHDDEATDELFGAHIAGEDGPDEYLRTGDLGFEHDGELFVTGRLKDVIILGGRNHHAHDLEIDAETAHDRLRPHCSAAFSIEARDGSGRAGLVLEADPPHDDTLGEIVAAVRRRVAHDLEVQVGSIVLVAPGAVPKTTSGKIQRRLCRQLLQDGELEPLAEWHAPDV